LIITIGLSFKRWKEFRKEFRIQFRKNRLFVYGGVVLAIIILGLGFVDSLFVYLAILMFFVSYLYIYAKAVDEVCMVRNIPVRKLTEGDWLYEDVKVKDRVIKANWDGLLKKDIEFLKKYKKKVLVRYGIQYAPVFLISFVLLGLGVFFDLIENIWSLFF